MEEKEEETTDWPTFHRVLLRKSGEHVFSISLVYLMIVSGFNDASFFHEVRYSLILI